jgi:hypothetical protein
MKSPKVVESKVSRIGRLSMVTWMVVSLSAGTALAADFTLRKVDKDGVVGEEVKALELQQQKDAKELLTTVSTDAKTNVEKYVELFSKEPTQFVEGIAEAVRSVQDAEKRTKLKEELLKDLNKVLASAYGIDKDALLKAVESLLKLEDKNLDKLTRAELLKEIFAGKAELLAKLSLSEKDKTVAKKDETKKVEEKKEERVGEVMTDAQITQLAKQQCDQVNGVLDRVKDQFTKNANAINEAFNRIKEMSKLAQVAPVAKKEQAEDVIPQLMKELMEKNKQPQHVTPAPPQVASAPEKEEAPAKNSVLDQPLPQPQQQQPQNQMPYMPQSQVASSSNIPDFSPDLPTNTGASLAIRRGQDAAALGEEALTAGVPSLTNQFTGRPLDPVTAAGTLGAAKTTTESALTSVSQELKNSKNKLSQLTQVMDRLKNDAANAIPESLKQLKSDKEQALAKAKEALKAKNDQLQPMMQQAMMSGGDQNAMMQAQMQQKMMAAQETAAVAQAQSDLDAITAKENLVKSKAKPELAAYESQKNALEDTVSDLQAQKTKLDSQKQQIAQMLQANAQQALASSQQQQPANMYNRFGNSSAAAPANTRGRGLGNALNPTRGSLGGSVGNQI